MNFYFYDLETTGLSPFQDRIMQFGGQRVDSNFKVLGEVDQFYVRLSEDILPHPQAVITHKILPQTANLEGLSEYQFLNWLEKNVYIPETVYAGYNIMSFDNQFMRWLHWRNFGGVAPMMIKACSLDIYKLLSLAGDLRPKGLVWPQATNPGYSGRDLQTMAALNKIETTNSHTAGADVTTTIALARLLKKAQPKLFDHFLQLHQADFVKQIIASPNQPFVFNNYNNLATGATTTLATVLGEHPTKVGCFIVYDLRADPQKWSQISAYNLGLALKKYHVNKADIPPLSLIDINRAPVVAPINVLDADSIKRLALDKNTINRNWQKLKQTKLAQIAHQTYLQLAQQKPSHTSIEGRLAQVEFSQADQLKCSQVREAGPEGIAALNLSFDEPGLKHLQFLYQARNFPKTLKTDQIVAWEKYRQEIMLNPKSGKLQAFKKQLRKSLQSHREDAEVINLLEELQLYVENLLDI